LSCWFNFDPFESSLNLTSDKVLEAALNAKTGQRVCQELLKAASGLALKSPSATFLSLHEMKDVSCMLRKLTPSVKK
jgi:hypothetical protein